MNELKNGRITADSFIDQPLSIHYQVPEDEQDRVNMVVTSVIGYPKISSSGFPIASSVVGSLSGALLPINGVSLGLAVIEVFVILTVAFIVLISYQAEISDLRLSGAQQTNGYTRWSTHGAGLATVWSSMNDEDALGALVNQTIKRIWVLMADEPSSFWGSRARPANGRKFGFKSPGFFNRPSTLQARHYPSQSPYGSSVDSLDHSSPRVGDSGGVVDVVGEEEVQGGSRGAIAYVRLKSGDAEIRPFAGGALARCVSRYISFGAHPLLALFGSLAAGVFYIWLELRECGASCLDSNSTHGGVATRVPHIISTWQCKCFVHSIIRLADAIVSSMQTVHSSQLLG
ncbi:hypothetical protein BD779DRAFT_1794045, partial [Infundibulicybe gibba]